MQQNQTPRAYNNELAAQGSTLSLRYFQFICCSCYYNLLFAIMSLTTIDAKELLRQLDRDRASYLATLQQVADALTTVISTSEISTPAAHYRAAQASTSEENTLVSPTKTSFVSGEDEDASDDDEALYVQDHLAMKTLDDEHLRSHLKNYKWNGYSREILKSLFNGSRLKSPVLFQAKKPGAAGEDGAHYSLYQVFDVGNDGSPLPLHENSAFESVPKDQALWQIIQVRHGGFVLQLLT